MARLLIDTIAYAALLCGDGRVADEPARSEAALPSPIVIGEPYDGFRNGERRKENREIFDRFRAKPRTHWVSITDAAALIAAA